MEDTQPNEVRLSRKGSTNIPRVRTTHPVHIPYSGPYDSRPSKRFRWQPPARAPLPGLPSSKTDKALAPNLVEVEVPLPRECHKEAPGSHWHNARKRWIGDQKHHLWTDRHLSVVSFKYSDNSVLFTCRVPTQFASHHARDSTETGSHRLVRPRIDTESIGSARQAPSLVKDSRSDLAQSSEPGPSRIRPIPWPLAGPGGYPRRLHNHSLTPSSGHSFERKFVGSSTTENRPPPVQIVHTSPLPRHRAAVHTASPTESIIDLTLDSPGPAAEDNSARWSTFRSGYVDISLPPLISGSRISSPETGTDPRPSIDQTPALVVGQCKDMPVAWRSNTNPRSVQPNIRADDPVTIRSMEDQRIDEAGVPPSSPDYSPLVRGFTSACGNLPLSLGPYDRPRRILHEHDFTYVVTAHGIIDQIGATSMLKLDHNIRSPSLPFEESIDDACILSHQGQPVIIFGHAREQNQITFLSLGHGQVSRHITLRRDWNTAKRHGVSAMTSLASPLKFASGGYDHRVHLWDIAEDLSGASAVELSIKHASLVHSLLPIVDTSHKLVSVGADCDVPIYDMSAERVAQTLKMSCTPYHAHKTDSRFCTLLEVSHLETQFEIRDHRMLNHKPGQPVQRFGFLTEGKRGRFEKADSWSHFVACGDRNGAVRLWDLRNVSTEVALQQCFNDPVIQVVNTGPRLLACSKRNELACINCQGEAG